MTVVDFTQAAGTAALLASMQANASMRKSAATPWGLDCSSAKRCISGIPSREALTTLPDRVLVHTQLKAPELKALVACEPPLARGTQLLCAGRLITLVEVAGKAGAQPRPHPGRRPGPEGKGAALAGGAQPGTGPAGRPEDGAAGGAHEHGAARENALLADVTAFLAKAAACKVRAEVICGLCPGVALSAAAK